MLDRTTRDAVRRLRAIRATVERGGSGEVLVSRRTKLAGEKGRAFHGRAIANMMADLGHDVFEYDAGVVRGVAAEVARGVARSIQLAWARGSQQQPMIRALFLHGAETLAESAHDRLLAGGLGTPSSRTIAAKERAVRQGRALAAYVHIYGVRSRRFADGIRARWRAGRRGPR